MLQETVMTPSIREINIDLIAYYGLQMTLTFLIGLGLYSVKVLVSKADTITWYRTNGLRIMISFLLFWVISSALVVVPNIASMLGAIGFNADQSAAGIALVIVGFLVGGKVSEVSSAAIDPVP